MFPSYIVLLLLLSGGGAFFIHDTQQGLCLEDSPDAVRVTRCDLSSESQQWVWLNRAMLMCVASSRCLWAGPGEPARTRSCDLQDTDAAGLMWDCGMNRLINRKSSLPLAVVGQQVTIATHTKSRWSSLDEGNICQEKLRLRRASDDTNAIEFEEQQTSEQAAMSKAQREYLQWYYRTEDPTTWKFVLLGVAFVCLLIGFLLLGMGSMANKSRKKIAKYKAAASLTQRSEGEELQGFSSVPLQGDHAVPSCQEESTAKAGDIVVTWKDGNTSSLYSDHIEEEEKRDGKVEELQDRREAEEEEQDQVPPEGSSPGK